jgi:hypothetical protein
MSGVVTTDPPNRATRIARWLGFGVPGLLLIACIAGVGWFLFPVLFPQIWANHLSFVQGKAELLAGAGEQLDFGSLSPDGRWMVLQPIANRRAEEQPILLDLINNNRRKLDIHFNEFAWLNDDQFVVLGDLGYSLFDTDMMSTSILKETWPRDQYLRSGGFQIIRPWLSKAQKIYAIQRWETEYTLFVQTENRWSVILLNAYEFDITIQQLKNLVAAIPHIDVPKYGWTTVNITGQRVYSPDGQLYVTREGANKIDVNEHAAIYTRDGQLVASAYKAGWDPYVLGWAHDGNGVYVQFAISGGAAKMFVPDKPLFKLSPYTPEEQRWQEQRRIGIWAGGGVLLASVCGIMLWRRRRMRR